MSTTPTAFQIGTAVGPLNSAVTQDVTHLRVTLKLSEVEIKFMISTAAKLEQQHEGQLQSKSELRDSTSGNWQLDVPVLIFSIC